MSLEIRWFFNKSLAKDISEWSIDKDLKREDERSDIYILFPATELGVKFSRGKLEIKYLKSVEQFDLTRNKLSGWMESWMKSSVPLVNIQDNPFQNIKAPHYRVKKVRYTRRFECDPENRTLNPIDKRVHQGIKMEITSLKIETKNWWTLGFEAFGDNPIENLKFGISKLIENSLFENLKIEHSYSYPKWLSIIEKVS